MQSKVRQGSGRAVRAGRWQVLAWLLALGGCCAAGPARLHGADASRESDLKATLLYNFTQFVEWPREAFSAEDAPLVIGVLGRDPFGKVLDKLVEQESVAGHRIVVERFRDPAEAARCHLLFISSSERADASSILESLKGRPILTVAEFDDFLDWGGVVQLHKAANKKIRLRVNLSAARSAELTLSAKLLRVAETVQ